MTHGKNAKRFLQWLCLPSRIGRLEFLNQTEGQTFSISLRNLEFDIPNGEVFFSPITKTTGSGEPLEVLALWVSVKGGDKISQFPLSPSCVVQFEDWTDLYWKLRKDPRKGLPEIEEAEPYLTLIASYFETSTKVDQFLKLPSSYQIQKERIYTLSDFDFLFSQSDESQPPSPNKLSEEIPIEQPALEIDASLQVDSEPEGHFIEEEANLGGWIKLYRKIEKSSVFQNEGLLKVWVWCLIKANHQEEWVPITTGKGTTEVLVKRGQFVYGRKSAAKTLSMDESTIYKRMMKLKNMGNCNIESNTHYSIVTVINWDAYQSIPGLEVTPKVTPKAISSKSNTQVTPKEHPSNTNKKDKNIKNNIGRSKKKTDPRVKEFLHYWTEIFQKETGQPYVFSFGKEGKLVKTLLQVHPIETLQESTRAFFQDEQCKRRGLTIGIFYQEINRLVGLKGKSSW